MINTIYKITNIIDGKIYIGQTWGKIETRFCQHCQLTSKCIYLKSAIQYHGKDNFTIEAVCYAIDQADANYWEGHFIRRYDSDNREKGYNLTGGGNARKHSEESKKKMSLALKGKPKSEKHKLALSKSKKGKPVWPKGKKHTEKTKAKISKSLSGCTWKMVDGKRKFIKG